MARYSFSTCPASNAARSAPSARSWRARSSAPLVSRSSRCGSPGAARPPTSKAPSRLAAMITDGEAGPAGSTASPAGLQITKAVGVVVQDGELGPGGLHRARRGALHRHLLAAEELPVRRAGLAADAHPPRLDQRPRALDRRARGGREEAIEPLDGRIARHDRAPRAATARPPLAGRPGRARRDGVRWGASGSLEEVTRAKLYYVPRARAIGRGWPGDGQGPHLPADAGFFSFPSASTSRISPSFSSRRPGSMRPDPRRSPR